MAAQGPLPLSCVPLGLLGLLPIVHDGEEGKGTQTRGGKPLGVFSIRGAFPVPASHTAARPCGGQGRPEP